jgi:hypothetical protein
MKLKTGDIIQYHLDDWSYRIIEISLGRRGGEINYECIDPKGNVDCTSWCHTVEGVLKYIENGKVSIIHREMTPSKQVNGFKFL